MKRDGAEMQNRLTIPALAVLLWLPLYAAAPHTPEPLVILEKTGYTGAIFPASRGPEARIFLPEHEKIVSYWTPTPEDIADLEAKLRVTMLAATKDSRGILGPKFAGPEFVEYSRGQITEIVSKYDRYGHQYVGIIVGGSKRIFVNAFGLFRDDPPYWRVGFVDVMDGGPWYWRVLYDLKTQKFSGFNSNGYA